jgi:hypothetical protein
MKEPRSGGKTKFDTWRKKHEDAVLNSKKAIKIVSDESPERHSTGKKKRWNLEKDGFQNDQTKNEPPLKPFNNCKERM